MSITPRNQEDEFYSDLDQKTERKSFCNCYTMVIFFGIILIVIIILTIYVAKIINRENINVQNLLPLISEKIHNDENIIAKNPTLNLVVSADELNSILPKSLKSYSLTLENPKIAISQSGMLITGELATPIKIPVTMTALVLPKEGKVNINIVKSKMGFISLPGVVRAGVENSLNELMDTNFAEIYQSYEVNNIILAENQMTIVGNIK